MILEKAEAAALSRLFSSSVIRELCKNSCSPLFANLVSKTRLSQNSYMKKTVGEVYDDAFDILRKSELRDDYIFRSAVVRKILLGRHSLNTATLLNEVRTGACKADLAVLNGTSSAYEIKSDRDSLEKLHRQISSYRSVFANVYVVTNKANVGKVLAAVPEDVGVIILTDRFTLRTERPSINRPERIDPTMLFEVLRVGEAFEVLTRMGIDVPEVPNTQIYDVLRNIFSQLDPVVLHKTVIPVLKSSRSQLQMSGFITEIPVSLKTASLTLNLSEPSRIQLRQAIDTRMQEACSWR